MKVAKRNNAEEKAPVEGVTPVEIEAYEEDGLVCISVNGRKYFLEPEQGAELADQIADAAEEAAQGVDESEDEELEEDGD
jgi:hypothetical protein